MLSGARRCSDAAQTSQRGWETTFGVYFWLCSCYWESGGGGVGAGGKASYRGANAADEVTEGRREGEHS